MGTEGNEQHDGYSMDCRAGPVYRSRHLSRHLARRLGRRRGRPYIISMMVWPYPEYPNQTPELRNYYALNLPQAAARAVEIEIRLREQELQAALIGIRPATRRETNAFFRVMDELEAGMPASIPAMALTERKVSHPANPSSCGAFGTEPGAQVKDEDGAARTSLQSGTTIGGKAHELND